MQINTTLTRTIHLPPEGMYLKELVDVLSTSLTEGFDNVAITAEYDTALRLSRHPASAYASPRETDVERAAIRAALAAGPDGFTSNDVFNNLAIKSVYPREIFDILEDSPFFELRGRPVPRFYLHGQSVEGSQPDE
jgi:hypothetical protein